MIDDFATLARHPRPPVFVTILRWLTTSRKWWLAPIILVALTLVGLL